MDKDELIKLLELFIQNTNCKSSLDYVSIVISIVAIIVSFLSIYIQIKLNNTNLQSVYFEEIFGVYLKEKIPKEMSKLEFNSDGKINEYYRNVNSIFMKMVRDSVYFKYVKKEFYLNLIKKIKELEDYLLYLADVKVKKKEKQKQELETINNMVQDIFLLINKNYQRF